MENQPNLYDRLAEHPSTPAADGKRPTKWVGSGYDGIIKWITITPDSIYIEGVKILAGDGPIRVDTLADDLNVVHLALFVEQVVPDSRVEVETTRTYLPPPPATSSNTTS